MNTAAYQKARRDKARAEGKCIQCCKRPRLEDRSRCQECLDYQTQYEKDTTAPNEGKHCATCGQPGHDKRTCRPAVSVDWCDECLAANHHRRGCRRARQAA